LAVLTELMKIHIFDTVSDSDVFTLQPGLPIPCSSVVSMQCLPNRSDILVNQGGSLCMLSLNESLQQPSQWAATVMPILVIDTLSYPLAFDVRPDGQFAAVAEVGEGGCRLHIVDLQNFGIVDTTIQP